MLHQHIFPSSLKRPENAPACRILPPMDLRQPVSPITHSQLPALNQNIGIPTRNISSPPKGDETVAGADWPVRGATLAAIGDWPGVEGRVR